MAGERSDFVPKEVRSIGAKVKETVLFVAEKSTIVTLPATGILFLAGAITGGAAAVAGGVDLVGLHVAKQMRKKKEVDDDKSRT